MISKSHHNYHAENISLAFGRIYEAFSPASAIRKVNEHSEMEDTETMCSAIDFLLLGLKLCWLYMFVVFWGSGNTENIKN